MKGSSFGEWCKEAGPIGPALWLFEGVVEALAHGLDPHGPGLGAGELDENAEEMGLFLMLFLIGGVVLLLVLITLFPR